MKLPGIEYNTRVQDLGKHDIYGPIRAANATARAAASRAGVAVDNIRSGARIAAMTQEAFRGEQRVIEAKHRANMAKYKAIGDFIGTAYQLHADAEITKASREYEERMALGLADLEKNKYDRVEQPDGTYKLISRHDKLEADYDELTKTVRESVREGMTNPHAKMSFDKSVAEYESKKRVDVKLAAAGWQRDDAAATFFGEYRAAMAKGDFQTATNIVENGIASEAFSYDEGMKMVDAITVSRADSAIRSAAEGGDYALAFETLEQNKLFIDEDKGRKVITGIMADNLMAESDNRKTLIEKAAHYDSFMATSPSELGITETEHGKIAMALRGRIADHSAIIKAEKEGTEVSRETQNFRNRGGRPRTKGEIKQLESIFEQDLEESGSIPASILGVAERHAQLPENAITALNQMLRHEGAKETMDGLSVFALLMQDAGINEQLNNAVDKTGFERAYFLLEGLDSGRTISQAMADYDEYTAGKTPKEKERIEKAVVDIRKSLHKDHKKAITEAIGGKDAGTLYFDKEIAKGPMQYYFDDTFEYHFKRFYTGDAEVATTLAIKAAGDSTRANWGIDNGEWKFRPPAAILPSGDQVYVEPELREFAKRNGVEYDNLDLSYGGVDDDGHFWFVRDKETGNFLFDMRGGQPTRLGINFNEGTLESAEAASIRDGRAAAAADRTKEMAESFVDRIDASFDSPVKLWAYDIDPSGGIYEGASFSGMRDVAVGDIKKLLDFYSENKKNYNPSFKAEQTKLYNEVFNKRFARAKEMFQDMSDDEISGYISTDMYESNFMNFDHYPESGRP